MNEQEEPKELRGDYIRGIIGDVECGKARWSVEECVDGVCTVQIHAVDSGKSYHGIKWTIGPEARKEAVLTVLFQSITAMFTDKLRDHFFNYKGVPVFKLGDSHKKLLEDANEIGTNGN